MTLVVVLVLLAVAAALGLGVHTFTRGQRHLTHHAWLREVCWQAPRPSDAAVCNIIVIASETRPTNSTAGCVKRTWTGQV